MGNLNGYRLTDYIIGIEVEGLTDREILAGRCFQELAREAGALSFQHIVAEDLSCQLVQSRVVEGELNDQHVLVLRRFFRLCRMHPHRIRSGFHQLETLGFGGVNRYTRHYCPSFEISEIDSGSPFPCPCKLCTGAYSPWYFFTTSIILR